MENLLGSGAKGRHERLVETSSGPYNTSLWHLQAYVPRYSFELRPLLLGEHLRVCPVGCRLSAVGCES